MAMRLVATGVLLTGLIAFAAVPKPKPDGGARPKLDLGMPSNFGALPTGADPEKPKEKPAAAGLSNVATNAEYSVVKVIPGKSFVRTAAGAKPAVPYEAVATEGNPPTTERFSTVVRLKCPQKVNAQIEVMVLDPRGDTLMNASGEVYFRNMIQTEVDYTVDWERTALLRGTGDYQVMVRVSGQPLGTFPLKIAPPPEKK